MVELILIHDAVGVHVAHEVGIDGTFDSDSTHFDGHGDGRHGHSLPERRSHDTHSSSALWWIVFPDFHRGGLSVEAFDGVFGAPALCVDNGYGPRDVLGLGAPRQTQAADTDEQDDDGDEDSLQVGEPEHEIHGVFDDDENERGRTEHGNLQERYSQTFAKNSIPSLAGSVLN